MKYLDEYRNPAKAKSLLREIGSIVTQHIHDFSEELPPPVAEAVPPAVKITLDLLKQSVNV